MSRELPDRVLPEGAGIWFGAMLGISFWSGLALGFLLGWWLT